MGSLAIVALVWPNQPVHNIGCVDRCVNLRSEALARLYSDLVLAECFSVIDPGDHLVLQPYYYTYVKRLCHVLLCVDRWTLLLFVAVHSLTDYCLTYTFGFHSTMCWLTNSDPLHLQGLHLTDGSFFVSICWPTNPDLFGHYMLADKP